MMLRNFTSSIIIKIIIIAMGLAVIPVIITNSSLSVFGLYSTYLAYINLFLFFNTGFSQSIIKNLSEKNNRQRTYSQSIFMGGGAFLILSIFFISWFVFFENKSLMFVLLLMANLTFMYFSAFFSSYLNAYEMIYMSNNAELVGGVTRNALLLYVSYFFPSVESLLLSTALSYFITLFILWLMVKKNTGLRLSKISLRRSGSINIVKEVIIFSLSEACWRLFSSLDKILIQKILGETYVAIYNIAFTICIRLLEVSGVFAQIALPRFMKSSVDKIKTFKFLFLMNFLFITLQNLTLYFFSGFIIGAWLGEDIAVRVIPLLDIMLPGVFFASLNYVICPYLISSGDVKLILVNSLYSILFIYFGFFVLYFSNSNIVDLFVFSLMFDLYFMLLFFLNSIKVYTYVKSSYIRT